MVLNSRNFNEIDKEMSKVIRNIRFHYRNLVKIQISDVKTMNEIKLFIHHPTYPFNRFTFLVVVPKNYPGDPICVEPVDVSDEMRKQFSKDNFKFFRMNSLLESVLNFCNLYQDKQVRGSSISFPAVANENNDIVTQFSSIMSFSEIIPSSQTRSFSRINLMKKSSDKMISYTDSDKIDQCKRIVDMISNNKFQSFRQKFFRPNAIFKSMRNFYYDDFQQRKLEKNKSQTLDSTDTIHCPIDYINCIELNSYFENTVEYIFLHKNVDIHATNPDNLNLNSLLKNQYMISSVVQNADIVPTKPQISSYYMDSFISFSEHFNDKFLEDDNIIALGQNCQAIKKLMHEDITVKIINSQFLYSPKDIVVLPQVRWATLEPQKVILKRFSKNAEVQTFLVNPIDTDSLIVLLIQTASYLTLVMIDKAILDYLFVVSEESNISSINDSLNACTPELNLRLEDYLIIYESDIESFKPLNLSTTLIQSINSSHINVYRVNVVSSSIPKPCHQTLLSLKTFDSEDTIESNSLLSPLESMHETCLQIMHLPTDKISNLSNEIDFTLELDLGLKEQIQILNFFNIPPSRNQFQRLEFFIPIKVDNHQFLIKDCSQPSPNNCIRIHKINKNSILHSYFIQKSRFENSYNDINRKIFFQPLCGFPLWVFHNVLSYLFIVKSKAGLRRTEKMMKKYLDLPQIYVHQIYFSEESFEFLDNLSKSAI